MDVITVMFGFGVGVLIAVALLGFALHKGLGASTANKLSWILGYLSLAWGVVWPVVIILGAATEEAALFSLVLLLLWVSPIGGAMMLWGRSGTGAVIVIAAAYLGWTILTAIVIIGAFYFPAAVALWLGAVLRAMAPHPPRRVMTHAEIRREGRRGGGVVII